MDKVQFHEKLVNIQESMMYVALKLTANKEEAEELLQETNARVLSNQEKFVDNANFKGWFYTVMQRIFFNNRTKWVRLQTYIDKDKDLYNLNAEDDSGYAWPENVDLKEMNAEVERLNDDLRLPFTLFVKGYKYIEIAELLDKPLGTVKNQIHSARQVLQKELKDFRFD